MLQRVQILVGMYSLFSPFVWSATVCFFSFRIHLGSYSFSEMLIYRTLETDFELLFVVNE